MNAIKHAHEFGLADGPQSVVGPLVFQSDLDALGAEVAQGTRYTTASYWSADAESREWSQRYIARTKRAPTMLQAGVYGAALHYFQAVAAAGTTNARPVMEQMRALPIDDMMSRAVSVRVDGCVVRPMSLWK